MAALPFLITTATVAYVALFPDEGRIDSSKVSSPSSRIVLRGSSALNSSFFAGIGIGVGLSWLTSYEFKRRRLWQRLRLNFLSWLYRYNDDTLGDNHKEITPLFQKFRSPCQLTQLTGTPIPRKSEADKGSDGVHGSHLELVSPDWAMSSNLYCDVVTLPPGTELVSRDSEGVEFYYVIKGVGTYVDKNGTKHQISPGYGFIVDPEWYAPTYRIMKRCDHSNFCLLAQFLTDVN